MNVKTFWNMCSYDIREADVRSSSTIIRGKKDIAMRMHLDNNDKDVLFHMLLVINIMST